MGRVGKRSLFHYLAQPSVYTRETATSISLLYAEMGLDARRKTTYLDFCIGFIVYPA